MGWLRPEEYLIEDPDFLGKNRPGTPPKYRCVVTALGETVAGVRMDGEVATEEQVLVDSRFVMSPVLERQGVPLLLKRLEGEASCDLSLETNTFLHKLMTHAEEGLPMLWNDATTGQLPPLLIVRGDGVPFRAADWSALREMHDAMEREGHPDFSQRLRDWSFSQPPTEARYEAEVTPPVRLCFPVGATVVAHGLSRAELNGVEGVVAKHDTQKQRVGVDFLPPHGLLSLRPENLRVVRGVKATAAVAAAAVVAVATAGPP